jgi:hypothetical protein
MAQNALPHNVFISWSGPMSRRITRAVHDWLPLVIQPVKPFMSERDIVPGSRGLHTIASRLENIRFGIICITADNQESPWLYFEAGALSKMVDESRVIPLAFDVDKGQIRYPLA